MSEDLDSGFKNQSTYAVLFLSYKKFIAIVGKHGLSALKELNIEYTEDKQNKKLF